MSQGEKFRGRPPILIAKTVQEVANGSNPYARTILDREQSIDEGFVNAVLDQSVFSWEGRNPEPALDENGDFQGTDLDLLSFLAPMARRGAVIRIPFYRNARPKQEKAHRSRFPGQKPYGPLVGLTSSKKVHTFSGLVYDAGALEIDPSTGHEKIGGYRNYMFVGPDGRWYEGWDSIEFIPSAPENAFLTEHGLWTGNVVYFKNAIHPNRWQSVMGAPYLLLKMLNERLEDEGRYYRGRAREIAGILGIDYATGEEISPNAPDVHVNDDGGVRGSNTKNEKISVDVIDFELVMPVFAGDYPEVPDTREGYESSRKRGNLCTYSLAKRVRVITRADELAFKQYGDGRVAQWLKGRRWEEMKPSARSKPRQQIVVGNEMALRYRLKSVTDTVAVGFNQVGFDYGN